MVREKKEPAAVGATGSVKVKHNRPKDSLPHTAGKPSLLARMAAVHREGEVVPLDRGNVLVPCPLHDDAEPSLSLGPGTYYAVTVNCFVCGSGRDVAAAVAEAYGLTLADLCAGTGEPVRPERLSHGRRSRVGRVDGAPLPRVGRDLGAQVAGWASRLQADPAALALLHELRGISAATARRYAVGWNGARFILPVYDQLSQPWAELVNLRRPLDPPDRKLAGLPRHPTTLYLADDVPRDRGWAVLCEGELDCLLARDRGLPAVTSTGGAKVWRPEWSRYFEGLRVAVVMDCDDPGREGAARRAEALAGVAAEVRVVDLGLGEGEDVGDWFVKYRRSAADLRRLIREARS